MATKTTALSPVQSGQIPDLLDSWFETTTPAFGSFIIPSSIGYVFDLVETERPVMVSATLTFTMTGGQLTASAKPALGVSILFDGTETGPMASDFHPPFADGLPTIANFGQWTTFANHHGRTWMWIASVDTTQNADTSPIDFSFELTPYFTDLGGSYPDAAFRRLTLTNHNKYTAPWMHASWGGRFYIGLTPGAVGGTGTPFVTNPVLTVMWENAFTGLAGRWSGPGVRAVRDTRFGIPCLSDELVRDGYEPSLWVKPDDQDPEDPPTQFIPPTTEGVVDDDIPD